MKPGLCQDFVYCIGRNKVYEKQIFPHGWFPVDNSFQRCRSNSKSSTLPGRMIFFFAIQQH